MTGHPSRRSTGFLIVQYCFSWLWVHCHPQTSQTETICGSVKRLDNRSASYQPGNESCRPPLKDGERNTTSIREWQFHQSEMPSWRRGWRGGGTKCGAGGPSWRTTSLFSFPVALAGAESSTTQLSHKAVTRLRRPQTGLRVTRKKRICSVASQASR